MMPGWDRGVPLLSRWTFRRGFLDAVAVPAAVYLANTGIEWPATVQHVEVDLEGFTVPQDTIDYFPESLAREDVAFLLGFRGDAIVVAMRNPADPVLLAILEFIFNRSVESVSTSPGQILEAFNRHYGDGSWLLL
jgi:hypothetical protein